MQCFLLKLGKKENPTALIFFQEWAVLLLRALTIAIGNSDNFLQGGFFQLQFTV